ncbi:zinc finger CCCH domain-containing protein 32-like isoform X3 [Magnolia sinica]|nr:zinc finger CCCH domain-containing protein 32-like isoform X3 [Magnolia sinica]
MRTGFCGYGARCRYNHPRDRSTVAGVVRTGGGEFPERVGQPVCQYFLKTGTCKYGATCKYHHPRYGGGVENLVSLNYYGYPLRPGEKECSYYVKTGQCKFGVTCKFHHPQPAGISVPAPAPTFYPTVQSPSVPSPQYGMASWQVARPQLVPSSYVQGPYGPMLLSPGVLQVPGWSPYPPLVSPVASPGTQHAVGTSSLYGSTHQLSPSAPAYVGPFSPSSFPAGPSSSTQKEHMFPQRPGQPECQFYMKTGYCKYGSSCRYHHPSERSMPKTTWAGLPLRPGAPPCTFYTQHGYCKFGLLCKFDHPMATLSYGLSASSLADMPVAPYAVGATLAPSSSSLELRSEFTSGSNNDSFSVRMPLSENMPSVSVDSILSKGSGSVPPSHVQFSIHSSAPSSSSRTTGRGGASS